MTKREQSVKTYSGTPPATAFGATQGTPLVIDYAAAVGYFMNPTTGAVTALGGGGGGGGITGLTNDVLVAGPTSGIVSSALNLANRHEWTATQNVGAVTLTDASTITPNGALSNNFYLLTTSAVGGTRNMALPSSLNAGDIVNFEIVQPASSGPCAIVWATGYKWGRGGQDLQPIGSTVASSSDFYSFTVQHDGNLHGVMIGQAGPTGAGYTATSTTSLATAGSGSKAFTTQAGLAYTIGARIRATSVGTGDYMEGLVTSYASNVLTVTMDRNSGTGTHADWDINLAGDVGAQGIQGNPGGTGPAGSPSNGVNLQTGTTYTVLSTDGGKLVSHSNASAIAVTLPQATGSFTTPFVYDTENRGVGTVTITPTTSTIDGAATLALTTNQGCRIFSDGTNWYTQRGVGGSASGTVYSVFDTEARPNNVAIGTQWFFTSPNGKSAFRQVGNSANTTCARGTLGLVVGAADAMFEMVCDAAPTTPGPHLIGLVTSAATLLSFPGADANGWGYYGNGALLFHNGASAAYGTTYNNAFNDRTCVGCRVKTNGDVVFYVNGASQGVAVTLTVGITVFPAYGPGSDTGIFGVILNTGPTLQFPVVGVGAWG